MSVVDPKTIRPDLPDDDVYQMINDLSIDYYDFARDTGLYWRMYGVFANAPEGGEFGDWTVNSCLRDSLYKTLLQVQELTERELGFNISKRHHVEKYSLPLDGKIQLSWPGIDEVNVEPTWTSLDTDQALTYISQSNVTVTESSGAYYVLVDSALFPNPEDVIIRGPSLERYFFDTSKAIVKVGSDWQLWLNRVQAYNGTDQLDAYHKRHLYITYTFLSAGDIPLSFPTYPGTKQQIPVLKTDISGLNVTYTVPAYAMTKPEFLGRQVNIEDAEYYKLLDTFDMWKFEYTANTMTITLSCENQTTDTFTETSITTSARILDRRSSLIQVTLDPVYDQMSTSNTTCANPLYSIEVKYTTDPQNYTESRRNQITTIRRAMLHKVAAELPTDDCGCPVKVGFIAEQQRPYATVYTDIYGNSVSNYQYGQLHGQAIFGDMLAQIGVSGNSVFKLPIFL